MVGGPTHALLHTARTAARAAAARAALPATFYAVAPQGVSWRRGGGVLGATRRGPGRRESRTMVADRET